MEVIVRGATSNDLGFILATMPRSLRYHSKFWEATENGRFHKNMFELVRRIVLNPSISLRILSDASEPTLILSYAVISLNEPNRAILYAYTKPAFRKQGYLKKLVDDLKLNQTAYVTQKMENARKRNKLELNPWLLLELLTGGISEND